MKYLLMVVISALIWMPSPALAQHARFNCQVNDGGFFELTDETLKDINSCSVSIMSLSSRPISGSVCIMRSILAQSMFQVYCGIANAGKKAMQAAMILYIIFYSVAVIFGINNTSLKDAGFRALKIAILYTFATNPEFFYTYLYKFFVIQIPNGFTGFLFAADDPTNPVFAGVTPDEKMISVFSNIDRVFANALGIQNLGFNIGGNGATSNAAGNGAVIAGTIVGLGTILLALSKIGFGSLIAILLLSGIIAMIVAVFRLMNTFFTSMIGVSVLLMFTPIIMALALFNLTDEFWKNWLANIISFTIQPLIVIFFLFLVGEATDKADFIERMKHYMKSDKVTTEVDMVIFKYKVESVSFIDSMVGQATKDALFYGLAFFILHAVMTGFMGLIPQFAQVLSRFGTGAAPPITASNFSISPTQTPMRSMEDVMKGLLGKVDGENSGETFKPGEAMERLLNLFSGAQGGKPRGGPK